MTTQSFRKYKCIEGHRVRLGGDMIWFEFGDVIEVADGEASGDILIGYWTDENTVCWKRTHASVLRRFKEVL